MKKGLYLIFSDINQVEPDGIEKKMMAQLQMFREIGIDMHFERLEYKYGTDWNYKNIYSQSDFIYFRKETVVDWRMIAFLRKIKKQSHAMVFMEIPTYPYDGEFGNSIRSKLTLSIDHYFRRQLYKYIDRIVVTGCDDNNILWGIKTVNVVNGIDLKNVPVRKYQFHNDGLNLACVAKFSPWHGYERIILGLNDYYRSKEIKIDVNLLMVGEGVEKAYYQSLVEKCGLENHVRFLGKLTGEKLENIYDITDVGVCSLGRYKSGINMIGDLKSRDFMAKGIPMICGCQIDVLYNWDYDYAMFVPNDNTKIDIAKVVRFYEGLLSKMTVEDISQNIRREAEKLIDYTITYKPVLSNAKELLWNT